MPVREPLRLPGYKIEREIGSGGQAKVYLAIQESFQRKVAIKVLLPSVAEDHQFTERFLREAHIVASLSHSYIIPVYDFGQQDDVFYMVMEYLPGGCLKDWIQRGLEDH